MSICPNLARIRERYRASLKDLIKLLVDSDYVHITYEHFDSAQGKPVLHEVFVKICMLDPSNERITYSNSAGIAIDWTNEITKDNYEFSFQCCVVRFGKGFTQNNYWGVTRIGDTFTLNTQSGFMVDPSTRMRFRAATSTECEMIESI